MAEDIDDSHLLQDDTSVDSSNNLSGTLAEVDVQPTNHGEMGEDLPPTVNVPTSCSFNVKESDTINDAKPVLSDTALNIQVNLLSHLPFLPELSMIQQVLHQVEKLPTKQGLESL